MFYLPGLLLVALTSTLAAGNNTPPPFCKAYPGHFTWPSDETWARFNESIGGRVLRPSPPGAVCHPGPVYDAGKCKSLRSVWDKYDFHADDPVSLDWNQFANDTCLPDEGAPCSGQGYPVFVVNASSSFHVKAAVDFARNNNIRLVIKSTGHDYIGRSNAPNSLSIWTHYLRARQVHDSFRPQNCAANIPGTAITVGAGTQMNDLYSYLDKINQTIVGGGGTSVSVGGYLTGAGHGLLSSKYGLGADQVLEMEVVTPDGEIITANECNYKDLFWALRGGGGSTFGVVISATVKTFPSPRIIRYQGTITTTNVSDPAIWEVVAYVLGQFPSLGDKGLTGYAYFFPAFPNPFDGGNTTVAGMLLSVALLDSTTEDMTNLFAPVLANVSSTWPSFAVAFAPTVYPTFYSFFEENHDTNPAGVNQFIGSRLLDAKALTNNLTRNADVYRQVAQSGAGVVHLVSGKGVRDAKPRGGGNAVLPAWRKAYIHLTNGLRFQPWNATARAEAIDLINYMIQPMRDLAPDMGAYMNEASVAEPDWQRQFWGENYQEL